MTDEVSREKSTLVADIDMSTRSPPVRPGTELMITVECMVYWMIAEFMQGPLIPEKLVCIYQSFRRWNGSCLYRPNGWPALRTRALARLTGDEATTLGCDWAVQTYLARRMSVFGKLQPNIGAVFS